MSSYNFKFTSNKEIDAFVNGSYFTKMTGWAESIEGIKSLGKTNNKRLFRFLLNNNGGKRVRILAWDDDAVTYEAQIKPNMIYTITGLKCMPIDPNYFKDEEKIIKQELHVTSRSKITKRQLLTGSSTEILIIQIQDLVDMHGPVRVEGFIMEQIEKTKINNKYSSGIGAICKGDVMVQVNMYIVTSKEPVLPEGTHVIVSGRITREKNFGHPIIQCNTMTDIIQYSNKKLSEEDLSVNFTSPKRQRLDNKEENKEDHEQNDDKGIKSTNENKDPNEMSDE